MISILSGNCLDVLPTLAAGSVQMVCTSPPYFGLRRYLPEGHPDAALEIGGEQTPDAYVAQLVAVFREVRRVLADTGCVFLNLGDSYRDKQLLGIPWRVAFALQSDGWWLRSSIIWHKPNPLPEPVSDRPTLAHENVFLLTKNARYFYNQNEAREPHTAEQRAPGGYNPDKSVGPMDRGGSSQWDKKRSTKESYHPDGRNWRNVWTIASGEPSGIAHFAMMPTELAERCIKAGSRPGDTVLDPFGGAGTTALVADRLQRNAVIVELNPVNVGLARGRIADDAGMFAVVA